MKVVNAFGNIKQSILGIATSGAVTSGDLADGAVFSGCIASGQISRFHLASGAVGSGHVGSGAVMGQAGGGAFNLASGRITNAPPGPLGSGAILSGHIGSGQISTFHFYTSGEIGVLIDGAAATNTQLVIPISSGLGVTLITEEIISGGLAACISESGGIIIAMAGVSGRMPAVGVVMDNVLSGIQVNVYAHGTFQFTSGMAGNPNASGFEGYSGGLGRTLVVARSGFIVPLRSGANNAGSQFGNTVTRFQRIGVIINSGGFIANVDSTVWSGQIGGTLSDAYINPNQ